MTPLPPPTPPRLDVALTIRRTLQAYARDFAAVLLAGIMLVVLPAVLARSIPAAGDWTTLVITARAVCAMLYVALVSWGVVARYSGRALPPRAFLREGLARATPGLQVALLAGAAIVAGLTVQLFARHGTLAGWALDALLLAAGLWAACVVMPVVPAAVAERLSPMQAFRRAAALTEGNRNRILVLALLALFTLAPTTILAITAGNPWLLAGVELLAWSLAATLPAVIYTVLRGAQSPDYQ
ncbi:hypothetical protein GCM10011529_14130 [Polymorphobacter glacialis]|uniref:Uncharacterized protein n=1 Tax=Sandarakinorhabdus glacialis TaxID=1614636 RepID=A0A917E883_9SPHN|nr:hypothetical protein [Polymorphobacter glacialis]GGE08880.1 hypothetical protein GCM10011529_14130 [Polymorphobacter glacialis]